jgi:hypothetical protein
MRYVLLATNVEVMPKVSRLHIDNSAGRSFHGRMMRTRYLWVWLAVMVAAVTCGDVAALDVAGLTGDIWLVSTREAPAEGPVESGVGLLVYWQWHGKGWHQSDAQQFLQTTDPAVPVSFYVHGNNNELDDAIETGLAVYRKMTEVGPACRPFRWVIWTWPSDRYRGSAAHNLRLKAHRSEEQGYYLAWVVDQLPDQTAVALTGHSFGARLVAASLEYLGGGCLHSHRLARSQPCRTAPRAVLTGAAFDSDGLAPGSDFGRAVCAADQILVVVNSCDKVLKLYPLLESVTGPTAIGYTGAIGIEGHGACAWRIEHLDVTKEVGPGHLSDKYLASPTVLTAMWDYMIFPRQCSEDEMPEGEEIAPGPMLGGG